MVENVKLRIAAKEAGVPLWKVSRELNVGEATLYRWLRDPLPKEKEAAIKGAIEKLSQGVR